MGSTGVAEASTAAQHQFEQHRFCIWMGRIFCMGCALRFTEGDGDSIANQGRFIHLWGSDVGRDGIAHVETAGKLRLITDMHACGKEHGTEEREAGADQKFSRRTA